MSDARGRLFLERRSYQRRRIADAGRALPFLGLALWLLPLAWANREDDGVLVSSAAIFLFAVWSALIALGAVLARLQRSAELDERHVLDAQPSKGDEAD